jgi:hypothetical protein
MDITIYCQDADLDPVDDVLVRLYTALGVLLTSGTTGEGANEDGEVILTVAAAGSYVARFSMADPGYAIVSPQSVVVVADGDDYTIDVVLFERPQATDPRLCRVSGFVQDLAGNDLRSALLQVEIASPPILLSGAVIYPSTFRRYTTETGYVVFDLVREQTYRIKAGDTVYEDLLVPDSAAVDLADLLYPIPISVTFTPTSVTTDDETTETIAVSVVLSDGSTRGLADLGYVTLDFVSDVDGLDIAQVGDNILVSGSAGSYNVTAEITADILSRIVPAPDAVTGSITVDVAAS